MSQNHTKTVQRDMSVFEYNTDPSQLSSNTDNIELPTTLFAPYDIERILFEKNSFDIDGIEWKKMISNRKRYSENYLMKYSDGVFDIERKELIEPSVYAYDVMVKNGLSDIESIKFVSCMVGLKVLGIDGRRYSTSVSGSYSCFPSYFVCSEYEFLDDRDELQRAKGYCLSDNTEIDFDLFYYICILNNKALKPRTNTNHLLCVKILDFIRMDISMQFRLISRTKYIYNNCLYIQMLNKNEIGNCGRKYNTMNIMSREDRACISNLYGIDVSTAMQSIICSLFPELDIPITKYYINNKNDTRIQASELMQCSIERAKMEITSIYQGRIYCEKYEPIKKLFVEAETIRNYIYRTIDDNTLVSKYARRRCCESVSKKYNKSIKLNDFNKYGDKKQRDIMNSYMFFYWTFYERKIQNIIAKRFKYPFTLHDCVYTQNKDEYDKLDIDVLIEDIANETGISIKLG